MCPGIRGVVYLCMCSFAYSFSGVFVSSYFRVFVYLCIFEFCWWICSVWYILVVLVLMCEDAYWCNGVLCIWVLVCLGTGVLVYLCIRVWMCLCIRVSVYSCIRAFAYLFNGAFVYSFSGVCVFLRSGVSVYLCICVLGFVMYVLV